MLARTVGQVAGVGGDLYAIGEKRGARGWSGVRLRGRRGKRSIRIRAPAEEARNSARLAAWRDGGRDEAEGEWLFLGATASHFSGCALPRWPPDLGPAMLEKRKG